MSINVVVAILDAEGLSPNEKIVAISYADHAHHDGTEARAGLDRIARKSSLSRRTVNAIIKNLLEKKVMEVQRPATNKNPVCYRFLLTPDAKSLVNFRGAEFASQDDLDTQDDDLGVQNTDSRDAPTCTQTVSEPSQETLLGDVATPPTKFDIQFDELWKNYPKKRGKADASTMVRTRLREGTPFDTLLIATTNYALARAGEDPQFTVWPKRFYNKTYWRDFVPGGDGTVPDTNSNERSYSPVDDTDWQAELERRHAESTPAPKGFADSIRSMKRET